MAGDNEATQTCYMSNDDPLNAQDTNDEMTGVFLYFVDGTIHISVAQLLNFSIL